jgi:hypothetical protein
MKKIELILVKHSVKIGQVCENIEPNITDDCIFTLNGKSVGFYIKSINKDAAQLAEIANREFRSDRVPKTMMARSSAINARRNNEKGVEQYSTIIGSCPPKPHMRRPYPTMSSVHQSKSSQTFIKAMIMLGKASEQIIKDIMPEQYSSQCNQLKEVPDKWRLGDMFTSSISNYNIPASYHRDTGNIQNTVNSIITKREHSVGGCLNVPDYNITIEQADNSLLVYPAWANIHGVTPIQPVAEDGYRNSLIFYPLKAFKGII